MGYYTLYEVTDSEGRCMAEELVEWFTQTNGGFDNPSFFDGSGEPIKWYDYAKDMCAFSLQHPDKLFIVNGRGEGGDDVWRMYVKNGKFHRVNAQITFESFDPNKLK